MPSAEDELVEINGPGPVISFGSVRSSCLGAACVHKNALTGASAPRMALYLVSLKSERITFSIGFDATDDDAAVRHFIGLVVKAKAPAGSSVTIARPDDTTIDVSDAVAAYLDRPEF